MLPRLRSTAASATTSGARVAVARSHGLGVTLGLLALVTLVSPGEVYILALLALPVAGPGHQSQVTQT